MISKVIKEGVKTGMLNARFSYPAIIQSFDAEKQTVTASIAIQQIIDDQNVSLPLLVDVPIIFPTVGGFSITLPIQKDDECVIIFGDRCIDEWFANGGVQKQSEHRVHHLGDGMAIIGINSQPNVISDYSAEHLVIRNAGGDQKITLESGGDIKIETTANVSVDCVDATITTSGDLTANVSGSASLTAPDTTITSATTIDGTLDVTGAITSAVSVTAPNIVGSASVTVGGVEIGEHAHGGVQGGSSNTAPMA